MAGQGAPMKKDDDREDDAEYSPFYGIEKASVLQEARVFNDSQLDTRRCAQVITKLLYLLNQGETFTKTESTEVFFSVTKLFQSRDTVLRRMVYLMIKEISTVFDEVIIVTSILTKDTSSKIDLYRANAIRVLCTITDSSLLTQVERHLKQAVVDKNPIVASAALVSGIHLLKTNPEVAKRWGNEVQEAVSSKNPLVQFHAMALLRQIKQNDRLGISKMVSNLIRSSIRSPLAQCLLVRYTNQVMKDSVGAPGGDRPFHEFLESCLRHKSEMTAYEAARIITNSAGVSSREVTPAITTLQMLLTSSKPVQRFAAVRTLNKLAMTQPLAVANCNIDLESLINDQNRNIATLAITTLLKTGNETGVERLMKQITNFMSDIADEFKIVVVEAIRSLCLKFPQKYRSLMTFLSSILREEGGFDYKKAIVDSMLILINEIPDAKESGLMHLCDFIEDCEFTYLSTQILHLLGVEGARTTSPSKYIRYIYNRVILENANVRASAVSSLAKFGLQCDSLRPRIVTLLRRCIHDHDDEVRDRATMYLSALEGDSAEREESQHALFEPLHVPLANLEASLQAYVASETPFDINAVPMDIKNQPATQKIKNTSKDAAPLVPATPTTPAAVSHEKRLSSIPGFSAFGKLLKTSEPVELTEAETEYSVTAVKHIYPDHIAIEFNCTNTIVEQVLEQVTVLVDASENEGLVEALNRPIQSLPYGSPGQAYVVFKKPAGICKAKFSNVLKFVVKEVDAATNIPDEEGYEDEYQLEDLEVTAADYFQKTGVTNFKAAEEELEAEKEAEYDLGARESLQDAVQAVIQVLGMQACDGTETVAANARSHTCLLSAKFMAEVPVLVRLHFGLNPKNEVMMKMVVRSSDDAVCSIVHNIID